MYISTFYREILGLKDDKLIGELVPVTEIQHFRKGERLIATDRKLVYVMFLLKGIVRGFFWTPREVITQIVLSKIVAQPPCRQRRIPRACRARIWKRLRTATCSASQCPVSHVY